MQCTRSPGPSQFWDKSVGTSATPLSLANKIAAIFNKPTKEVLRLCPVHSLLLRSKRLHSHHHHLPSMPHNLSTSRPIKPLRFSYAVPTEVRDFR
ncbi:hypothetical protein C1H46_017114 [Malus baccata]|uniref:Uncharacterized protein n=1 Tax=Malus baccata TaxID=106549 RepID=A0A540MEW3_MALBA|nr:hypothetical protein C1H46_017114 [Malus baccata]